MWVHLKISLFKAITFLVLRRINLDVRNATVTVKVFCRYLLGYAEENQRTSRSEQRVSWLCCAAVVCWVPKQIGSHSTAMLRKWLVRHKRLRKGIVQLRVFACARALCLTSLSKAKIIQRRWHNGALMRCQWWGKSESLRTNVSQCHFIHHIFTCSTRDRTRRWAAGI